MSRRRARGTLPASPVERTAPAAPVDPRPAGRWRSGAVARLVRRRQYVVLAALLGLYFLLALLNFEPQPHTGGDNAGYITLARSLLDRHAYLDLYDPAEPPHTKYPPVFPLVLAGAMALGITSWVGLKLIVVALGGGAVAGTFLWLRRRGRSGLALGVGLLLALAPGVLREVHWVLSDVPFWCFTALALWAFERLDPRDWRRFALAAGFTTLAYFTRSAGLPLVLAAGSWLLWRRHWQQLLAFALVLLPLVFLWWLRARALGGVQYVGEFWLLDPYQPHLGRVDAAGLLARVGENIGKYLGRHLPILLTGAPSLLSAAAGLGVIGFGAYGWARRLRRPGGVRVPEIFLPLYLGLILLWPAVWSGERFLLPVLGLLLAYAGDGVVRAFGRRRGATAALAGGVLLALLTVPVLVPATRWGLACTAAYRDGEPYACLDEANAELFLMAEWAGQALPADAVVLSRKPRLFYAVSGLQGRNYPMASTTEALLATADSAGARWVMYDQLGGLAQRYLVPALLQRPGAFCIEQSFGASRTTLFGIRPDAATTQDAAGDAAGVAFEPCAPAAAGGARPPGP